MKLVRGNLANLSEVSAGSVVTIGNFDGVHLGHRFLIKKAVAHGKAEGLSSLVISFSPHPSRFFDVAGFELLSTEQKKISLIESLGVDILALQTFDPSFSKVTKEDFLRHYLLGPLNPRAIHFGYDFRYGANGDGDFGFAESFFEKKGVETIHEPPFDVNGERVSSSLIRDSLRDGDVCRANSFLGNFYSIQGVVQEGEALGRQIGFPTANLGQVETLIPRVGVYGGFVQVRGKRYKAVVNIGTRPTVSDKGRQTIECHILDFSDTIYGEALSFEFVERIRDELKFSDVQSLKAQLKKDVDRVRKQIQ